MTNRRIKAHLWTVEEIKKFVELWETETKADIADELGLSEQQVQSMAYRIRKLGYKLKFKTRKGYIENLIREALGLKNHKK